jgi:hypothetical protein
MHASCKLALAWPYLDFGKGYKLVKNALPPVFSQMSKRVLLYIASILHIKFAACEESKVAFN